VEGGTWRRRRTRTIHMMRTRSKRTLEQVRRMVGKRVKQVFVDRGYRGHGYDGEMDVHVDKQRKGKNAQATVEVDEKTSRGGTRNQAPETRASDESQSTERNPGRSTQRSAQCSGNELQEVAQACGEDLALHSVDAQPGRTPTSHAIQSEHCPLPTLTQLKPPFSASTM